MFRCEVTGEMSKPGESPVFIILEKRFKEYYGVRYPKKRTKSRFNKEPKIQKLGEGYEIVREAKVLRSTYEKLLQSGNEYDTR